MPTRTRLTSKSIKHFLFFNVYTYTRPFYRVILLLLLFSPMLAVVGGWFAVLSFLHPIRRPLSDDLIREADASFSQNGAKREDFSVRASDDAQLHGWRVRAANPNGSWILAFHGVTDNRVGVISQSEFRLRAGYNIVMMDVRAHGESEGQWRLTAGSNATIRGPSRTY
jgi:hypothetical protein